MISIIIPMYNAEKYIDRCLKSIVNQTYRNLEVIIVNDGSTDKSEDVCKKWMECDHRIICINKKNEGVSKARNTGLDNASGRYIWFVDADDYIADNTAIDMAVHQIKERKAQLCVGGFIEKEKEVLYRFSSNTLTIREYMYEDAKFYQNHYFSVLWNKIFLRDIIEENNIRFNQEMSWGEDSKFLYTYLENVENVTFINKIIYYYRYTANSLSKKTIDIVKRMQNNFFIFEEYEKTMNAVGLEEYSIKYFLYTIKIYSKMYFANKQGNYKDWKKLFLCVNYHPRKLSPRGFLSKGTRIIEILYRIKAYCMIYIILRYFYKE